MIKINKTDLELASKKGLLNEAQIEPLWQALQDRPDVKPETAPAFDFLNVSYYFGALLIIFGMAFFTNEAWELKGGVALFSLGALYVVLFTYLGYFLFHKKQLIIPGGLLATVAVCMVPLTIFGFQKMTGFWLQGDPGTYREFHTWIKGSWFFMEIGTILYGLLMLRSISFTFLSMPIFFSLWYLSMDIAPLLFFSHDLYLYEERKIISMIFGGIILFGSYLMDRRTKEDYAFWGYVFGALTFWGALSLMDSQNEFGKFIYFVINIIFILVSVILDRRVFIIFGVLGSLGYLGHLANRVFKDFLSFPLAITFLGLGIVYLGIKYQKNKSRIDMKIKEMIPPFILELSPLNRIKRN